MLKIEKIKNVEGDYEGLNFVIKAMTNDKTRKNIAAVLWDGACYWATDGNRLHYYYAKKNDVPVGVYTLVSRDKNTIVLDKNDDIRYPDISVLTMFRKNDPIYELEIDTRSNRYFDQMGACSTEYSKIIRRMADDETLNFEYIKQLPPDHYTVYAYGPKDCICFANTNKGAAIMPMKCN
jgi:hypothetical protein